jgi:hypothetical protein
MNEWEKLNEILLERNKVKEVCVYFMYCVYFGYVNFFDDAKAKRP